MTEKYPPTLTPADHPHSRECFLNGVTEVAKVCPLKKPVGVRAWQDRTPPYGLFKNFSQNLGGKVDKLSAREEKNVFVDNIFQDDPNSAIVSGYLWSSSSGPVCRHRGLQMLWSLLYHDIVPAQSLNILYMI